MRQSELTDEGQKCAHGYSFDTTCEPCALADAAAARAATSGRCRQCRRTRATPADLARCSSLPELRPPGTTQLPEAEAAALCWAEWDEACQIAALGALDALERAAAAAEAARVEAEAYTEELKGALDRLIESAFVDAETRRQHTRYATQTGAAEDARKFLVERGQRACYLEELLDLATDDATKLLDLRERFGAQHNGELIPKVTRAMDLLANAHRGAVSDEIGVVVARFRTPRPLTPWTHERLVAQLREDRARAQAAERASGQFMSSTEAAERAVQREEIAQLRAALEKAKIPHTGMSGGCDSLFRALCNCPDEKHDEDNSGCPLLTLALTCNCGAAEHNARIAEALRPICMRSDDAGKTWVRCP